MNQLFENVLTASFHGSIVVAAVIVLRLALKKTPKKYVCLLWLLALVRLLMPFEIQSSLSLQPEAPVTEVQWRGEVTEFIPDSGLMLDLPDNAMMETAVSELPGTQPAFSMETSPEEETVAVQPVVAEPERQPFDWTGLVPWLWLAVACGFGLYSLVCYLRLKRQVRFAVKIPGGWECEGIDTAFILGFIRPKIYIPMGMPQSVRKHILAHERTHLEKGDHWFKMVGYIALAIHWFNPLVWAAYILMCKDIEMACDQRVVQFMELPERKEYSAALLRCSTNKAHFAACPVAFGEVSVKSRIKSVLNYRKPGFWVSLLGVAAIVFVTVCLVTSPDEGPENGDPLAVAGETNPEEETVGAAFGYATDLDKTQIIALCRQAIEDLKARESYYISRETVVTSDSEHYGSYTSGSNIRRHQEDFLLEGIEEDGSLTAGGGSLYFEGRWAGFDGDKWAWSGDDSLWGSSANTDPDSWLDAYSPEGKMASLPEIVDGDTVSFFANWTEERFERQYIGTFYFTFHDDGTLASVSRDYVYEVSTESGGGEVRYVQTFTVMEEAAADTRSYMEAVAAETLTAEELKEYRLLQEQVTEVPSNKTTYDKEFTLGASQMGWKFMKGEWFFKFGAEDVTNTGLKLVVEYNSPYGGNTVSGGTMTTGTEYFIERLVDGVWTTVPAVARDFTPIPSRTMSAGSTQTINWEANYGELPAGFYRIGNSYTFTANNGQTDTQVCYAKFRLYDPNQEALLEKCSSAFEALLSSDSYHIYSFDWLAEQDYEYYLSSEVWKSGKDYLEITKYPLRSNTSELSGIRGSMWRDGKYYGLTWRENDVSSPVSEWWLGVDGYLDDSNFEVWTYCFAWYDSNVEWAYQEGNTIHIIENNGSDVYPYIELVFTFDNQGNLKGVVKEYLPDINCAEEEKVAAEEFAVFDSTARETAEVINAQDVSTPMAFSYADDVRNNPDAQTSGFKNTAAKPITTPAEAIARADRESTMPQILNFDNGYLQTRAYRDEAAGMWKVELFWWQHDTAQTVYMNDQGITQRIVSVE